MCHLSMKHLCQKLLKFNKARSSQLKCRGCFLRRKRLTDLNFIFYITQSPCQFILVERQTRSCNLLAEIARSSNALVPAEFLMPSH